MCIPNDEIADLSVRIIMYICFHTITFCFKPMRLFIKLFNITKVNALCQTNVFFPQDFVMIKWYSMDCINRFYWNATFSSTELFHSSNFNCNVYNHVCMKYKMWTVLCFCEVVFVYAYIYKVIYIVYKHL